jgi:hypothetical protein
MGYTHYFGIKKTKGDAEKIEKKYQYAIKQCTKVIQSYYNTYKGTEYSLSGFSAHAKIGRYGGLHINGKGNNAHEDFCLREHFTQNKDFDFCKTAQKPYDKVVVACLIILKHYLKDNFEVNSDGDAIEWIEGLQLSQSVLKLKSLKLPKTISIGRLKLIS